MRKGMIKIHFVDKGSGPPAVHIQHGSTWGDDGAVFSDAGVERNEVRTCTQRWGRAAVGRVPNPISGGTPKRS